GGSWGGLARSGGGWGGNGQGGASPPPGEAPHTMAARRLRAGPAGAFRAGRGGTAMTPQERQLIADLFERLAALENQPRDPEAEQAIRAGLAQAPHAVYPLVQTVLVQDEALKAADAHIRELEDALQGGAPASGQPRGFLDSMRDAVFGRDERAGP